MMSGYSRCAAVLGSWFLVLGSWFLVPSSWFFVLGWPLCGYRSSAIIHPPSPLRGTALAAQHQGEASEP